MAPRNRSRKVGLMRIDAALASLRPWGFSDQVIRKSVKDLLKVYGGDDGWYFIEDASYKLLIETILEGQQPPSQPEENQLPAVEGNRGGDNPGGSCGKSQSVLLLELCPKQEVCQAEQSCSLKDHTEQAQLGPLDFAPKCSPMIVDCVPTNQKHKPCYGWISDDEDDDFLLLPPANGVNPN